MIQNENTDLEFKQIKTYKKLSKKQKQKIETFFKSIIYFECRGVVYDLKTTKFEIVRRKNKFWKPYMSGTQYNYVLAVNGLVLRCKERFILKYKCITCNTENTILNLTRLIPKLFRSSIAYCTHCLQKYDITHRTIRHNALTGNKVGTKFAKQKAKKKVILFEDMPNDWKDMYWQRNFTIDEFWQFLKEYKVTHINGITIDKLDKYIPYVKNTTATKFSPKVIINRKIQSIRSMHCVCDICGKSYTFHWHDAEIHKTKNICKDCMEYYLVNTTWQLREYTNCKGNKITYQSNVEKRFIDFCNENNIEIVDGPVIPYFWNQKDRKYHIDFFIPKLGTLIEIKSMHKFQRDDIASGKFQAKCDAANREVKNGKYNLFEVIYDYDMTDSWKKDFVKQYNLI